jgi:hypothetical protein
VRKRWWRRAAQPGLDAPASQPVPDAVPPDLAAWAQVVDVSRLSDRTIRAVERYLRGYRHMTLAAGKEEGFRLLAAVEAQVSPPAPADAQPLDVLTTVLAARRKQLGIG